MCGKYTEYPEYKVIDNQWLDSIPAHWEVTALKHVLLVPITDGPHLTPVFLDEGVPFVSAEAVSSGYINFDKVRGFISEEDDAVFSQKYCPQKNDVYMIKSGATTGITAIVDTDRRFNIWSPLAAMRCKDSYEPYFLLNYLRSDTFQKSVQLSWSFGTQQNIGMNTLENLTVCYPPLNEQQKIADFLDHETAKIDTLIAKQEKLIALLKEKRQAVISHAVTKGLNPVAKMKDSGVEWLGEVPEHWVGGSLQYFLNAIGDVDHYMPASVDSGIPYVMTGDLNEKVSNIDFDDCKQVDESDFIKLSKRIKTSKGDIIMARYATIGSVSYVDIIKDFLVSYSCVTIKPDPNEFLGLYLFYFFKSHAFSQGIQSHINTNTQGNVGVGDLKIVKVAKPNINEQKAIVDYLELHLAKIDNLTEKSAQAINLMKERKTALISAAVTGKIDVRCWEPKAEV